MKMLTVSMFVLLLAACSGSRLNGSGGVAEPSDQKPLIGAGDVTEPVHAGSGSMVIPEDSAKARRR
jgi:hypothetical protein